MSPRSHRLQRRVAIIVVAGLLVSFALFGFLALEAVQQSTQSVFQERLMMAQITAAHIDYQLKEALDYLQSEPRAQGIDLYGGNLQAKRGALAQIRARLPIFAQQVYLVDRNGTVLLAEPSPSQLEGANMYDYVHIRRVLQGSKREVSGVILDPITRAPTIALAVPVTNASGNTVGVLGASMDIASASLASLILGLKPGQTGHTQILDGNGTVMASTEPDLVLHRSHHYDLLFSLIRQKTATVVTHATENGSEPLREIVAFAPLSNASWGVSVEQSESEAMAVGRDLETHLIALGVISLLGALVTSVLVLRRVLIPIESLTLASERIAAGDLGSPLAVAGDDEIGRLAFAFETMRGRLKQSRDELDRWHRELELRVRQRTAELSCLFELSKTITSSHDVDGMLRAAVRRVVEVLDSADAAYLYLEDPLRGELTLRASQDELPERLSSLFRSLASETLTSRKASWCEASGLPGASLDGKLENAERWHGPEQHSLSTGMITCAPLLTQEKAFGALLLVGFSSDEREVSNDLAIVQALADQIAAGIERARLTQEAEQAAALREADRLKSQFVSAITHELQTPLGFIKGYATTLLRPNADFDENTRREFLQIIDEESDSLSALIDDLLDMSRIEAGALTIAKQPVQLGKLIVGAVERVKAKSSSHQFLARLPAHLQLVEADPRRVEQVLQNLLDNAVKYSPDGGEILVSASAVGDTVAVEVADNGIGIPLEDQTRVFDRFYRAAGAAAVSRRGVGLGLSICQGIVEAHGGTIRLESCPGAGTRVTFCLPALASAEDDAVSRVEAAVV